MTQERISWDSWRELEEADASYGSLAARRLPWADDVVLAVDHDGGRHVLLQIDSLEGGLTDNRSRGLAVSTRGLEVENQPERPFIDVSSTDPANHDAFDVVASSIAARVTQGVPPLEAVRETLARWRHFWGTGPTERLAPHEVRGVFGELWFLLVWLLPRGPEHVENWLGPVGARDDFQWPGLAIEAKATTSIRGHLHRIHGIDQLDAPEEGALLLFSLRMREEPSSANSIVSLIDSINQALQAEPERLDIFEGRLAATGYSPADADRYSETRFRVVDERLYRVGEGFPRLSVDSMAQGVPPGVERIEYVINLEGLSNLVIARSPQDLEGVPIPQWATAGVGG